MINVGRELETEIGGMWEYRLRLEREIERVNDQLNKVTLNLYLISKGDHYGIISNKEKLGYIEVDGSTHVIKEKGLLDLGSNEKKLIKTVTKSVSSSVEALKVEVAIGANITLHGTFVNTIALKGVLILD